MLRPKIIGLCGHPGHGKSEVQRLLELRLGVTPIDDGLPIRKIAMERHGLSWDDVSTQAGKARLIEVDGRTTSIREVLGLIGKEFEKTDHAFWARLAISQLTDAQYPVSLGSVRRTQGEPIIAAGGIVLEIYDPWKTESPFDFDQYDPRFITNRISNDEVGLDRLERKVVPVVRAYLES